MPDLQVHELMVHRLAAEIDGTVGVSVMGTFTPLAYAAYMLAKRTHAPDAWLVGYNAVDIPSVPLSVTGVEAALYRGATSRGSFGEITNRIHLGKRGLVECVSSAQIDGDGAINLSVIGDYTHPKIRLPGGAGAPEVVQNYAKVVAYFASHDTRTLVPAVDFATGRRTPLASNARRAQNLLPGPMLIVTPLAVLRKQDDAPFRIESCHPGVTPDAVVQQTGFALDVPSDVAETERPTADVLRVLREEVDPAGTSALEFLRGSDRIARIRAIIDAERLAAVRRLSSGPGPSPPAASAARAPR
ncbi:MAG: glutaconate CoA-transferase, subunit [Solirubrobacteraceae bacterium]|jgi:acyl CoA:acetate/3-ketoacid CoA transferase beta subunit|nr:glutaconate CoA-transferase, subunit [Solirubrobacteraceae bacterium]